MKPGAILINVSRGALIDTTALIEALKSGRLGGVALDVYEEEEGIFFEDLSGQVLQDDELARLLTFPNVLITSHQAFLTREALSDIARTPSPTSPRWPKASRSWKVGADVDIGDPKSVLFRSDLMLPNHKTKIVATIGPASESPEMLERLIRAGLNVARLNFSHGDFTGHAERIARIRAAEKATGRRVAIMADLPGPKMRVGKIEPEPIQLRPGDDLHADQRGHRRQRPAGLDELSRDCPRS